MTSKRHAELIWPQYGILTLLSHGHNWCCSRGVEVKRPSSLPAFTYVYTVHGIRLMHTLDTSLELLQSIIRTNQSHYNQPAETEEISMTVFTFITNKLITWNASLRAMALFVCKYLVEFFWEHTRALHKSIFVPNPHCQEVRRPPPKGQRAPTGQIR